MTDRTPIYVVYYEHRWLPNTIPIIDTAFTEEFEARGYCTMKNENESRNIAIYQNYYKYVKIGLDDFKYVK